MTKSRCIWLMIGGLMCLSGCICASDDSGLSMKGYELYSWPAGQDWDFSLLVGMNRLKTLAEIQSPDQTLHGVEAAKTALRQLRADEQIFWIGPGWLRQAQAPTGSIAIPPVPVRDEITALCSQLRINLTVNE